VGPDPDPNLDLIKGYGRALVREKIVAASSRRLVILVGDDKDDKLVPRLGSRGRLPVEVVPFGLRLCERRLRDLGCKPPFLKDGALFLNNNGNHIIDCEVGIGRQVRLSRPEPLVLRRPSRRDDRPEDEHGVDKPEIDQWKWPY